MVTSLPAMAVAGAASGGQPGATVNDDRTDASSAFDIDEALHDADGTTEMVVRFGSADVVSASGAEAVETMQQHAHESQHDALEWVKGEDAVEYKNDFWIANALLLEVDTTEVSAKEVAQKTGAQAVHANFDVEVPDEVDVDGPSTADTDQDVTYGLDMINATEVWEEHGTQGAGAGVAVLDTGIDDDHPDLEIAPENWQQFDASGDPIETEPNDGSGHGTHVSGTVVGPTDPDGDVPAYGVAPDAELYHGKVLEDDGGGTFAQIAAGMEWAVDDTDADVVTMSLGVDGYQEEMLEPSENARDAGVVLVASIGNSGQGVSGAPGNVYPNFASGAVDENADVAGFSSGEGIETDEAYPDAPDYWPDEYVTPNAGAPGVDVLSAVPGGGYDGDYSGTSMSAPHKAGTFALMVSASDGDADRDLLYDALEETAWQPDGVEESPNTEYGHGIIDAAAATDLVALDSGIEGTVTDTDGEPIEDATIEVDDRIASTDADGEYSLIAAPGEYTVTADGFGYASESADVTVEEEEMTVQNFDLEDALDAELIADQPEAVEGGETVEATVSVANVETVAVDLEGDYDEENATLYVAGEHVEFGEEVELDVDHDEVTVAVETTADTEGEFSLAHTLTGMGEEIALTTGPTTVFEELVPIAVVDDDSLHGEDIADTLDSELSAMYVPETTTSEEAMDGYDAVVVQNIDLANAEAFIEATEGSDTGVVYLDQWGIDSNGIPVHSDVTGEPADTDEEDLVSPPVDYELTADHPIFDGVGQAGDTVEIHNAVFGDHTWFGDTEFDVLAETSHQGTSVGNGFAVDDDSSTVFASNLGYTAFVGSGEYTDEADAILGNAVEYAASDVEPEPEPEPETDFQLEITDATHPVIEGDDLTLDVTVANAGADAGEQDVTLADFDGEIVDYETVELEANETAEVSLTWETNESDAGTGEVVVASDDDEVSHELTIHEEPEDGLLTFGDGEHVGPTNGTVDVAINTSADAVAGYETQVHFDPDVLQVEDVEGVDLADPTVNVNNDAGWVSLAQAQGDDETESPTLAEIEFAITQETSGTELVFDEANTFVNDAHGEIDVLPVDGTVESAWLGDVNADGEFNTYDVTLTQQYLAGDEPTDTFHEELADMNGNGQVGPGDVTIMLEEIVDGHGHDDGAAAEAIEG
ncbi:S8 family serine peptidase [Halobiforma nitratireducens]|nr:S8 family serine peptidase [Halobiforma nitratireducens]